MVASYFAPPISTSNSKLLFPHHHSVSTLPTAENVPADITRIPNHSDLERDCVDLVHMEHQLSF